VAIVAQIAVAALLALEPPPAGRVVGLPLAGDEAVAFLRAAEVVGEPEPFDSLAITAPLKVRLTDGTRTLSGIFKDENTLHQRFRFGDGRQVDRVRDSYRHEIAAHELDVMLGLGLVPPCVERTLFGREGALCLWVEGAITEADRRASRLEPPDRPAWDRTMIRVRLFHRLIQDLDFTNLRNLVVDESFRVYKVDSSMAFYPDPTVVDEAGMTRFSRELLAALEGLDRGRLDERLGRWLYRHELKALWVRRGRILELARERVAERGEAAVLY
jgi:hypothetical protein